jgi:hypothetical protein
MADNTDNTTDTNDAAGDEPSQQTTDAPKPRLYSKAEVDGMIKKELLKARKDQPDILELKTKAEEYDRLQETTKSEQDKLRDRADRAIREKDQALARAKSTLIRSAIISAASRLGSVDPEAVAALIPHSELEVDGDEVIGVEEAVKTLLAKKSWLRSKGAERAGAEINGGGQDVAIVTRTQFKKWLRDGELTPEREAQVNAAIKAGRFRDA